MTTDDERFDRVTDLSRLSDRQLFERLGRGQARLEQRMATLTEEVALLRDAIDAAVGRLQAKIDALTGANTDLSAALAAAQVDDADALAAAAAAQAAADDLAQEISDLAGVGADVPPADPDPVPDPAPIDPAPAQDS